MECNKYDVLAVIGSQGVGKSYLLNQLFDLNFTYKKSPKRVTTSQNEKTTINGTTVIDTVGWDGKKNNFLNLNKHQGKKICLVFLNNDLRIETSLNKIANKFGIKPDQINSYNCYSHKEQPDDYSIKEYKIIFEDHKNNKFVTFDYSPQPKAKNPEKKLANPPIKPIGILSSSNLILVSNSLSLSFFFLIVLDKESSQQTGNLFSKYDCIREEMFVSITPFSHKNCTTAIIREIFDSINVEYIKSNRRLGDSLIHYFCLQHGQDDCDKKVSNDLMLNFIEKHISRESILKKYGKDNISDEKFADVFEAIFYYIFSEKSKNRYFYSLLDQFLGYVTK